MVEWFITKYKYILVVDAITSKLSCSSEYMAMVDLLITKYRYVLALPHKPEEDNDYLVKAANCLLTSIKCGGV